jgi:15-cis-phytoene synthase
LSARPGKNFLSLMQFEGARTRSLFEEARRALQPDDAQALRPAELMRVIYRRILSRMEADGFQVFQKPSKAEKIFGLLYFGFCRAFFATSKRVGMT